MNEVYVGLREQAFTIASQNIGVYLENSEQVYAAVVDILVKENIVTLFCALDGTVSLYYSNGKCDIGVGEKETIRKAAMSFLVSSGQCLRFMEVAEKKRFLNMRCKCFCFIKMVLKHKR